MDETLASFAGRHLSPASARERWRGNVHGEVTISEASGDSGRSNAHHCFVCGARNPIGLHVHFRLEDGVCLAEFTPRDEHMGYPGVTHGGIVFSLLDDVMANWWFLQGVNCFTAKADIRYRQQLPIGTPIRLEGRCQKRKGRLAIMEGRVVRASDGDVFAEATGHFMAWE
ncbi:MAG: PaaI family thioesterase [Pseudomonadales bacterium]|nr:PaaI family thioesterase [Pseudomonadales bacterium]MCP5186066.1 PaaI family thioesterase [Pseudomonadales bacterium]